MNTSSRTKAASTAAQALIDMHINRRDMGLKSLLLMLGWTAVSGHTTEPEARILLGRTGMLKRYAKQGYLVQNNLPPGLKMAPRFPHQHYYSLTEKGTMMVASHIPHLCGYGNLELRQRTYLHDLICRTEAAWRIRLCMIQGYIPEVRLPELASPNHKQHDGHLIFHEDILVGLEVEAADWKSGDKLARFVAQCLNSITNDRVQGVCVLVQTEAALRHYSKPFQAGQTYCPEWVKESGRWRARQSSRTIITPGLAAKVVVKRILSEADVLELIAPEPTIFQPSAILEMQEAQRRAENLE